MEDTMKLFALSLIAGLILVSAQAEAAPRRRAKPRPQPSYETSYEEPARSAGGPHAMAGCGLGSMVIEDNSKWAQVGAAFLNGTGMQTFGISFGTSNCTEDGVASASREKEAFVEANLADLQRDVARGEGEYLSSLASLYGCGGNAAFGQALHKNQGMLMSVSPQEASEAIDSVLKTEAVSCQG
jgi:hypothetical protein